jgi:hypothetical protein
MALNRIAPPYPIFCDTDGTPLDAGYIYIGQLEMNPETNPISVFWDRKLTLPAPQPIRTINGYPSRFGTPAELFTDGPFSLTVRDINKSIILYVPNCAIWAGGGANTSTIISQYSGNGSTVAFTLIEPPDDNNDIDVFINGIYQQKNTYSIVGTVLTFSEAPITGTSNIEVIGRYSYLPIAPTVVQRFTGTGSQSVYTLSDIVVNSNDIDIYINGLCQQKNSYAIFSTTLTFSEPPLVGTENIEVIIRHPYASA